MDRARIRLVGTSLCAVAFTAVLGMASKADASCGSAACFLLTGEESTVHQEGALSVGNSYAYTITKLQPGTSGLITAVDQENRQLIMNEHAEHRTITELTTLDVNYGLTNNLTLELLVPYRHLKHTHIIERGSADTGGAGMYEAFQDSGIGDVRVNMKYSYLPTLRSLIVVGFGVDLPTGNSHANNINGTLQEPSLQIGRRAWGIVPSILQSYEIIPHVLDQFASISYQHAFTGPGSYRYGDVYVLSGGVHWIALSKVTLTGQFNWRYAVHDEFTGSLARVAEPGDNSPDCSFAVVSPCVLDPEIKRRPVPTTGSTMLAFSPGITVAVREKLRAYFFVQVPLVRDFNNNLVPDVGYLAGLSMSF